MNFPRIWVCSFLVLPIASSCNRKTETIVTPSVVTASTPVQTPTTIIPAVSQDYKADETDNIHAALLHEIITASKRRYIYYVTFNDKDPSNVFVSRMKRQNVPIRKMSRSPERFRRTRQSIKNPMIFVFPIRWLSRTEVEVQVDWPGAGTKYRLSKSEKSWSVTSQNMACRPTRRQNAHRRPRFRVARLYH